MDKRNILKGKETAKEQMCLGEYLKECVKKYPNHRAIVQGEESYTYSRFEKYVISVQQYCQSIGIKKGDVIGLEAVEDISVLICMWAFVSMGVAYLPIAPDLPDNRKHYMKTDSNAKVYFTKEIARIAMEYDELAKEELIQAEIQSPAYIIYTSGTTGMPKGVMVKQEWLLNLCHWYIAETDILESDSVCSLNALCFDASVKNIFAPVMAGASIVLKEISEIFNIKKILVDIEKQQVTHINAVPGVVTELLLEDEKREFSSLTSVKAIITGGERYQCMGRKAFFEAKGKEISFFNVYGPTECVSVTTMYKLSEQDIMQENKEVPIGTPITNKHCVIINEQGESCQPEEQGELWIGGKGIVDGYLNQEKLTQEKFVVRDGERYYRSGDLCHYDKEQRIYYHGRMDHQIKLNGYRIELEEIAKNIEKIETVTSAVCAIAQGQIVGFYIGAEEVDEKVLQQEMRGFLPEYMIPSHIIWRKRFPKTPNGKVDIKGILQEYEDGKVEKKRMHDMSILEMDIYHVWEEVLGHSEFGIEDNFFEVGGDSMKLIQMSRMLETRLHCEIDPMHIMQLIKVRDIAAFLENRNGNQKEKEDKERIELLEKQKRLRNQRMQMRRRR